MDHVLLNVRQDNSELLMEFVLNVKMNVQHVLKLMYVKLVLLDSY